MLLVFEEAERRATILDPLLEQVDLLMSAAVMVLTLVSRNPGEGAIGAIVCQNQLLQDFTSQILHSVPEVELATHFNLLSVLVDLSCLLILAAPGAAGERRKNLTNAHTMSRSNRVTCNFGYGVIS